MPAEGSDGFPIADGSGLRAAFLQESGLFFGGKGDPFEIAGRGASSHPDGPCGRPVPGVYPCRGG